MSGLRARDVTIQLSGGTPALGDKLLVFAHEWLYAVQIALREVAHHEATAQAEKEVEEVVERLPIRHLEARLDGAALVVDGEVESIGPSPVPKLASSRLFSILQRDQIPGSRSDSGSK